MKQPVKRIPRRITIDTVILVVGAAILIARALWLSWEATRLGHLDSQSFLARVRTGAKGHSFLSACF